jgi:hypothetical protein
MATSKSNGTGSSVTVKVNLNGIARLLISNPKFHEVCSVERLRQSVSIGPPQ